MRVIFCGTAAFAVPSLQALAEQHEITLVVTQQDRPAGRGRKPQESPVKLAAGERGIAVYQPRSLRRETVVAELAAARADVMVVAAYGKILPQSILDLPPHGCLNVHASLLPRHRGAAPVTAAILAGDVETGVTIMLMDAGLDTGPILRQRSFSLTHEETTASLTQALSQLGADLLCPTLDDWVTGRLEPKPQDDAKATYAPQLTKQDGLIKWPHDAEAICRHVRAMQPWPGAVTYWRGKQIKVLRARPLPESRQESPGSVVPCHDGFAVVAGAGMVALEVVQLAGKRALPAADFRRGYGAIVGAQLQGPGVVS